MNISKWLIGGIVGGIVLFMLGWLFFGTLLVDFAKNNPGTALNVDKKEMDFLFLGLGNLLNGMLLAYVIVKSHVNSIGNGFITGGIVGFLASAAVDCIMYGTSNIMSKKWMAVDVITVTVMAAIAGAVITMVTRNRSAAA